MNCWTYMAVHDAAGFMAAAYLVVNNHPVWAGVCLLLVATTTVRQR